MGEKIQFHTNVPSEVALKYSDGKDVTGQYGDQVLYTLTDDRVMYVPPIVRKQIQDLGIVKGEPFTITKAEKKNGTRRTIEWLVTSSRRMGDQPTGKTPALSNHGDRVRSNGFSTIKGENRSCISVGHAGCPTTGSRQYLLRAFTAAVDLAAETERYAGAHGISLQFTSEDVREIGLSIFARGGTE